MKQNLDVGPASNSNMAYPTRHCWHYVPGTNIGTIGMNCEKNAVVCEGYHEKQIWKSGKERAEEGTATLFIPPFLDSERG
jgi:hypothetical protein